MNNHQSTQRQSSDSHSKLRSSNRRSKQPLVWNLLLKVIKHYPWLLFTVVWAFLVALIVISFNSITSTESEEYIKQPPKPITIQTPPVTSSPTPNLLPLWLLGGVAFTCGVSGLIIYKRQKKSSQRPKRRRTQRSTKAVTRRQQRQRATSVTKALPPQIKPVKILPPQKHQSNVGEESLAEMMDIRKQQSLSSILDENFEE